MLPMVTDDQWRTSRNTLRDAGNRFADLVTSVPDPHRTMATADWSVAVTAAHVVVIADLDASIVEDEKAPDAVPGLRARIVDTTVDTVDALNEWALRQFTERDTHVLAGRLRADIDTILRASERRDPDEPMTWLGGARVPLAGLLAHLVNELLIHGYDIARVTGTRWIVPSRDAALFFDLLLVGLARYGQGKLLDGGGPPRDRRIAIEFRSRYTRPVTFVLRNGRVTAEEPGGDADARVRFDPATLNLMLFGRISRLRALLTRKVVILGRRPWLLPVFLRTVRVPDTRRTGSRVPGRTRLTASARSRSRRPGW
jgi:hypothetical protein